MAIAQQHELMNTEQAAEYLNLSKATLETWRCLGRGPTYRKLGRSVRYLRSDLEEWIDENRHEG